MSVLFNFIWGTAIVDFQQQFIETSRRSLDEAAALFASRMADLREESPGVGLHEAFTRVVKNDLKNLAEVVTREGMNVVVPRSCALHASKAMDLVEHQVSIGLRARLSL